MTNRELHDRLRIELDALSSRIVRLEAERLAVDAQIASLRGEHTRRRRLLAGCVVKCRYCTAEEFLTDSGELPVGWSRHELPDHSNEWEELEFGMSTICPQGHEAEIAETRQYHLEEYESVR